MISMMEWIKAAAHIPAAKMKNTHPAVFSRVEAVLPPSPRFEGLATPAEEGAPPT